MRAQLIAIKVIYSPRFSEKATNIDFIDGIEINKNKRFCLKVMKEP